MEGVINTIPLTVLLEGRAISPALPRQTPHYLVVTHIYLPTVTSSIHPINLSNMPSYTSITILAFGLTSFATGAFTLLSPETMLTSLSLPASSLPATRGNGLAALAMGIYYTLASVQENRAFFAATVPMRLLTAMVFWVQGGSGWRAAGLWEGVGAGVTAAAMVVDWGKERKRGETGKGKWR